MSADSTQDDVDVIESALTRLAGSVDELVDRTSPKNVVHRGLDSVKAKFVDPDGNPRYETIVPVVLGTVAVVATFIGIRRLVH